MKYAFLVLIAIYLITYGCSSDESKTETKKSQKPDTIMVKQAQPAAPATAAGQPAPPVAGEKTAQQVEAAAHPSQPAEQQVVQTQENSSVTAEPQPAQEQTVTGNAMQQATPPAAGGQEIPQNQEDVVVMPCGRVVAREDVPADMPCMQMQEGPMEDPMMEQGPLVQEEPGTPGMMPQEEASPQTSQEEMAAAMEKMVEATNQMVMVTRQMVIATEQMLKATQEMNDENQNNGDMGSEQPQVQPQAESLAQPAAPVEQAAPAEQPASVPGPSVAPADPRAQPPAQVPAPTPTTNQKPIQST